MKDYGRKIKISDLLRQPWKEDILHFENKFIEDLVGLWEEWIAGTIIVKALDRYSILVTLEEVRAHFNDISDISQKEYIREAYNPFYEALFIIPQEEKKNIKWKDEADEYFTIDEKQESIDISECVRNCLTVVEPVVRMTDEEKLLTREEDVESEYDQYV